VATVHYSLAISEEAHDQLRALPKEWRKRIGERMNDDLQNNLTGDVKKMAATERKYRLRVGSYGVLRLEGNQISVYAVKDRKEAYE
jgi:mRNA-degrading endonuclease RelE of RelBE toxin-antitoxin system